MENCMICGKEDHILYFLGDKLICLNCRNRKEDNKMRGELSFCQDTNQSLTAETERRITR